MHIALGIDPNISGLIRFFFVCRQFLLGRGRYAAGRSQWRELEDALHPAAVPAEDRAPQVYRSLHRAHRICTVVDTAGNGNYFRI